MNITCKEMNPKYFTTQFLLLIEVNLSTPRHSGPSIAGQAGPAACSINSVPGDLSLHIYGGGTGMQLSMVTNRPIIKLSYS